MLACVHECVRAYACASRARTLKILRLDIGRILCSTVFSWNSILHSRRLAMFAENTRQPVSVLHFPQCTNEASLIMNVSLFFIHSFISVLLFPFYANSYSKTCTWRSRWIGQVKNITSRLIVSQNLISVTFVFAMAHVYFSLFFFVLRVLLRALSPTRIIYGAICGILFWWKILDENMVQL